MTTETLNRATVFTQVFEKLAVLFSSTTLIASRQGMIKTLEAKSDKELAALGIARRDIAQHVFRDLFYG